MVCTSAILNPTWIGLLSDLAFVPYHTQQQKRNFQKVQIFISGNLLNSSSQSEYKFICLMNTDQKLWARSLEPEVMGHKHLLYTWSSLFTMQDT